MCLINYFTLTNIKYLSVMFHLESQLFYLLNFQLLLCESDLESSPMDTCLFLFAAAIPPSQGLRALQIHLIYLHSLLW